MMPDGKTQQYAPGGTPSAKASTDNDVTQYMGKAAPVGHLEIVEGPGAGNRLPISSGTNALGRDPEKNRLTVDFGDMMIGRSQHALVIYDPSTQGFGIKANGHPNPILLNGQVVTTLARLAPGDQIRIGQTIFRFLG